MRTVRTNFDRNEHRRDRRYPAPIFEVTIGYSRFRSINWSLSGVLVEGAINKASPGERIDGTLRVQGASEALPFSAAVVRADPADGSLALRFHEIGTQGVDFLDRAVARRLH